MADTDKQRIDSAFTEPKTNGYRAGQLAPHKKNDALELPDNLTLQTLVVLAGLLVPGFPAAPASEAPP